MYFSGVSIRVLSILGVFLGFLFCFVFLFFFFFFGHLQLKDIINLYLNIVELGNLRIDHHVLLIHGFYFYFLPQLSWNAFAGTKLIQHQEQCVNRPR